jgi:hypothetical protein
LEFVQNEEGGSLTLPPFEFFSLPVVAGLSSFSTASREINLTMMSLRLLSCSPATGLEHHTTVKVLRSLLARIERGASHVAAERLQ